MADREGEARGTGLKLGRALAAGKQTVMFEYHSSPNVIKCFL